MKLLVDSEDGDIVVEVCEGLGESQVSGMFPKTE